MSLTCYKTTGTIPAAIERGLCLAWTARWMKKMTASENSQLNMPDKGVAQLRDSIEQCIYLDS
jgi:hypothetical protein